MTTTNPYTSNPATPKQIAFIERLGGDALHAHKLSKREASAMISDLMANQPKGRPTVGMCEPQQVQVTEPGVYEVEGTVYVVKPNQAKAHLYAKRLVEINADRLNEYDNRVQIEFEYEPGAIFRIKPEHKMDLERAKALTIRYGRCIVCGKTLSAAKSVEQGIGPVCIKSFR